MIVHPSRFPPVEIPPIPVGAHVLRHAARLADRPALVDGPTGRTMTYAELAHAVRAFAGGLLQRGLGRGDVLALLSPNVPEYAVAFHGTVWAGGTVTTLNPTYTAPEIRHQLLDSGARFLVTLGPLRALAAEAAEGTRVEVIVTLDRGDGLSLEDLYAAPLPEPVPTEPDHVACLPYSSGTTGLSKGVQLTHRCLVANLVQHDAVVPVAEGEVQLAFLPFFHIYGMQVLMNATLASGGTVVTLPRFDLELFLTLAERHRVRRIFVVPPVVLTLAKHPLVDRFDLSSLECLFSGAAPLTADLTALAAERLGCEIAQGYGMTELSPVTHTTPPRRARPGAIGLLLPSTEARIIDPATGADLGVGQEGEIWIRGPQVMAGYLNNPAATAATIDAGGWLHTGDIGKVDPDGYFTIVDRLKELIKYKGFQVPPAELEGLLVTHPAVADAAVIGIPDDEAGELPKAFVVLKPDALATPEDLRAFVAERVAHYKQLRAVEFVQEIPKSASGKVLRRVLRARIS
jgi:acyl-CoA synthetase (AMP-forming)/AMP-acid ligase II